jgi:putative oxidoreductase
MAQQSNSETQLLIPGLRPFYQGVAPYIYPLIRLATGLVLLPHGCQKLLGMFGGGGFSGTMAGFEKMGWGGSVGALIAILEFFGALGVAFGFLTRFWAAALAIEFAVITFSAHWGNGFFWSNKGFEYPLLWGILFFAIALRGGGNLSIDKAMGKEL